MNKVKGEGKSDRETEKEEERKGIENVYTSMYSSLLYTAEVYKKTQRLTFLTKTRLCIGNKETIFLKQNTQIVIFRFKDSEMMASSLLALQLSSLLNIIRK